MIEITDQEAIEAVKSIGSSLNSSEFKKTTGTINSSSAALSLLDLSLDSHMIQDITVGSDIAERNFHSFSDESSYDNNKKM